MGKQTKFLEKLRRNSDFSDFLLTIMGDSDDDQYERQRGRRDKFVSERRGGGYERGSPERNDRRGYGGRPERGYDRGYDRGYEPQRGYSNNRKMNASFFLACIN